MAHFDDFSPARYEFANGTKPRGRGTWAFEVDGVVRFAPAEMTYADAKREAMRYARLIGASTVAVAT